MTPRPCAYCGTTFTPERDRAKYCTNLCANRRNGELSREAARQRAQVSAKCHPGRRHMAFGLCKSCYKRTDLGSVKATCHPQRKHHALGKCLDCYLHSDAETTKRRAYNLRKNYNITIDDYEAALALQGGRCLICQRRAQTKRLNVDHDPLIEKLTGLVVPRALLCIYCNKQVVGAVERYAAGDWLDGMAAYIERTRELRQIYLTGNRSESVGFTPTANYQPQAEGVPNA